MESSAGGGEGWDAGRGGGIRCSNVGNSWCQWDIPYSDAEDHRRYSVSNGGAKMQHITDVQRNAAQNMVPRLRADRVP